MNQRDLNNGTACRSAAEKSNTDARTLPDYADRCGVALIEAEIYIPGEPTYMFWRSMISCCTNQRALGYRMFGLSGVRVCESWRSSFASFLKDVGKRPSPDHVLELIDGQRNFEPNNVRWVNSRGRECEDWRHDCLDLEGVRLDVERVAKLLLLPPQIFAYQLIRAHLRGKQQPESGTA
jgi:hypothetical protein